jgi:hypothetical protein
VDFGNYLGIDANGDDILLNERGSGCVYRFWLVGHPDQSHRLRVYFDDETTPSIDMAVLDFFSGTKAPFLAPLVGNAQVSSGGFYSYVPLPYAHAIRITLTSNPYYFYNIDLHTFPADAPVASWTGKEDESTAIAMWGQAGTNPEASPSDAVRQSQFDVAAGGTQNLFDAQGPGEVTGIELRVPGVVAGQPSTGPLEQLWVKAYWDGEGAPSVSAPLGALFGLGDFGAGASGGLMAGLRHDGTLYLYFPMPFAQHGRVDLVNTGAGAVAGVAAAVRSRPFTSPFDDVGTFATAYAPSVASVTGTDLTFLDADGSGRIVGVVLSERKTCSGCNVQDYLEGDERAVIDGRRTPSVYGTGTEDFFNAAWYFLNGPFGLPTHGMVAHTVTSGSDGVSAYRFFVSEPITYRNHVRFSIQHGGADDVASTAWTLAYYYRQARSRLKTTDQFTVGDAAGEAAHQYAITGATWQGSHTYTFEGEHNTTPVMSTGRAHRGTSSFVLQVDPANRGVLLRRLLDQTTGDQRARVAVDGTAVGDWLTAGSNPSHAWREDDFALPAALTAGKSQLTITVQFVSAAGDWTEYQYSALSQMP